MTLHPVCEFRQAAIFKAICVSTVGCGTGAATVWEVCGVFVSRVVRMPVCVVFDSTALEVMLYVVPGLRVFIILQRLVHQIISSILDLYKSERAL